MWNTDNLVYTQGSDSYSAKNFRVPHHKYAADTEATSSAKTACRTGGVADGFFQIDSASRRNDFPVLESNTDGTAWSVIATGSKTSGCTAFVDAQLNMAARARSNGGYYLNSAGKLRNVSDRPMQLSVSGARFLKAPASRIRTYGSWFYGNQGRAGYNTLTRASSSDSSIPTDTKSCGILAHTANSPGCRASRGGLARADSDFTDPYLGRTDNPLSNRGASGTVERVASPQPSSSWEPLSAALATENEYVTVSGTTWYALAHRGICNRQIFLKHYQDIGSDTNLTALCPAGMHPRGQDGLYVIGESTGRSLRSITTETEAKTADAHWCRSDVRYRLAYTSEVHSGHAPPAGITVAAGGTIFYASGRSGCYYIATSLSTTGRCEDAHPVPQCTDPSTRQKRDWTAEELATWHNETVPQKFRRNPTAPASARKKPRPPEQASRETLA